MTDENTLIAVNHPQASIMSVEPDIMSPDYFVAHWDELLPVYIGRGRPSPDTLRHYTSSINQFLRWCAERKAHPLALHEFQIRQYLQFLYSKQYKDDSIGAKFTGIRAYYSVAVKLSVINENPCKDVWTPSPANEEMFRFFTPDQLYEICTEIQKENDPFIRLRNLSIIYLMGVEGLRSIEIFRMNREDIDWSNGTIFVRGKGHTRHAFPCSETLEYLDKYIQVCPVPEKSEGFTPMFISGTNLNIKGRLSRNGIKFIVNKALEASGYKKAGVSCHAFRHSAGTNLYAATKDLRLVQDTLGHRDPKVTARYAHLQERMTKRSTSSIVPRPAAAKTGIG